MKGNTLTVFLWRVACSHTIAYWIAGISAVIFLDYKEHYASESMSLLMLPVSSPMVALEPSLQIIRGAILAFVLYPFRKRHIQQKRILEIGTAHLWLVIGLYHRTYTRFF